MKKIYKSALNKIKAEDELIKKTKEYLYSSDLNKKSDTIIKFKKRSALSMKKILIAASVAVFICGLSIGGFAYAKIPVSYLCLDINPSVELGINAFDKVVSATGYNQDGNAILTGQDVMNTNVQDAVNILVKSACNNGFIAQDGSTIVAVTSETNRDSTAQHIENEAEQGAKEAIEESNATAVVYKDNVALARRDEARKLGITPGKLNLIQKLMALDPTATVEQYKNEKVTSIMKKVVSLKKAEKAAGSVNEPTTITSTTTLGNQGDISTSTAINTTSAGKVNIDIQNIEKAFAQADKNKKEKEKSNNGNGNVKSSKPETTSAVETTETEDKKNNNNNSGNSKTGPTKSPVKSDKNDKKQQ